MSLFENAVFLAVAIALAVCGGLLFWASDHMVEVRPSVSTVIVIPLQIIKDAELPPPERIWVGDGIGNNRLLFDSGRPCQSSHYSAEWTEPSFFVTERCREDESSR